MPALKAQIQAQALIRRAQAGGAMAMVLQKGDPDAGLIYLKVLRLDGRADLYAPTRDMSGARAYRRPLGDPPPPESEADAFLDKERRMDSDFWIIEVEDRQGRSFLTDPVID